jgi:hypothetical protein
MNVWDIETEPLPLPDLQRKHDEKYQPPDHPGEFDSGSIKYGNLTAEKRQQKLEESRLKHEALVSQYKLLCQESYRDSLESFVDRAALDPTTGRVLAIGMASISDSKLSSAVIATTAKLPSLPQE